MIRIILSIVLISLLAAGAVCAGTAMGVRGGYASHHNDALFVGGHLKGLELSPEIGLVPNIEIAFFDGKTLFSFNGDAVYSFETSDLNGYTPYIGGELGLQYSSPDVGDSTTKLGVSILGGLEKKLDSSKSLMFELKIGVSDCAPDLKLIVGLTFF